MGRAIFLTLFQARPTNLLDSTSSSPQILSPYSCHKLPEPAYATAFSPSYSLQHAASTLFLTSLRALPIRLLSPFCTSIIASYPFVSLTTEQYIAPHSLIFPPDNPNHFFAGSHSLLSIFDINRNGEGPFNKIPTTSSNRNKSVGSQMGMKGIVSTLGINSEGILAAGTFSRWVGLYDSYGRGGTVGVFKVGCDDDLAETGKYHGTGITQVIWSLCGRYLCVVERESSGVGVWDVRVTGRRLAWLRGRCAKTNQRLEADVFGTEVWAGGTDGKVKVWEKLGVDEGDVDPKWHFCAHDGKSICTITAALRKTNYICLDAVSSAVMHPFGSVLATCSGQRHFQTRDQFEPASVDEGASNYEPLISSSSSPLVSRSRSRSLLSSVLDLHSPPPPTADNSLKIWAL